MDNYSVLFTHSVSADEQKRRLAQCYSLILSWPEVSKIEPADSENFDRNTETAEENAPTCESEADLV